MLDTLLDQTTTTSYEIMLARAQAQAVQQDNRKKRDDDLSAQAATSIVAEPDTRSTPWRTPWLLLWTL